MYKPHNKLNQANEDGDECEPKYVNKENIKKEITRYQKRYFMLFFYTTEVNLTKILSQGFQQITHHQ